MCGLSIQDNLWIQDAETESGNVVDGHTVPEEFHWKTIPLLTPQKAIFETKLGCERSV